MKSLIFADGTKVECIHFEEGPLFFDGFNRRCITAQLAADSITFNKLDALLLDNVKTKRVILHNNAVPTFQQNDEGGIDEIMGEAQDVFDGYVIKTDLAKRPVEFVTSDGVAMWEERFVFQLVKRTTQETELDTIKAALVKAGIEL